MSADATATVPGRRSRRPGWWRHNALALAAILVLAPATLFVIGGNPWTANPQTPVSASPSGTVDLSGAEWGPVKAVVLKDTTGLDVPPHTKIVAVAVPVARHAGVTGPVTCDSPRLTEQRTGRVWEEVMLELGAPSSRAEPIRCPGDTSTFRLIVAFAVPEDARGPYWVDLPGTSAAPSFPRFSVDP